MDKEDLDAINRVDMLVHNYGLVNDEKLTKTTKELKKLIIQKVFEWDTLLYMKYE